MLLGIITCFGPALVISVVYGCMPPVSASMLAKADIEKEIIKYTEGIQGAIFASGGRKEKQPEGRDRNRRHDE